MGVLEGLMVVLVRELARRSGFASKSEVDGSTLDIDTAEEIADAVSGVASFVSTAMVGEELSSDVSMGDGARGSFDATLSLSLFWVGFRALSVSGEGGCVDGLYPSTKALWMMILISR